MCVNVCVYVLGPRFINIYVRTLSMKVTTATTTPNLPFQSETFKNNKLLSRRLDSSFLSLKMLKHIEPPWNQYKKHFFQWALPGQFFFIFVFSIQMTVTNVQYKFSWWPAWNLGPLVMEATALPMEPQPLPFQHIVFLYINAAPESVKRI